jgi:predicted nucleic-acid-binding protein
MDVAVDTNVVIRYITRDDPVQERKAREAFLKHRIFVPRTVLMETEWVLRFTYRYTAEQIAEALTRIVDNERVHVEDEDGTRLALASFKQGLDFADALHLAACGKVESFLTFDKPLFKRAARVFAKPIVIAP